MQIILECRLRANFRLANLLARIRGSDVVEGSDLQCVHQLLFEPDERHATGARSAVHAAATAAAVAAATFKPTEDAKSEA